MLGGTGQAVAAAPDEKAGYSESALLKAGLKGTGEPLHLRGTTPGGVSIQVVCTVSGSGPRRYDAETILFSVMVVCDGQIRNITMFLYIYRQVSTEGYSGFAARGPESANGTPFGVGVSRSDAVCLPATYVGIAHVIVDFLSGYPLHLEGIFGTGEIYIGC
jgi:hypothetical protein